MTWSATAFEDEFRVCSILGCGISAQGLGSGFLRGAPNLLEPVGVVGAESKIAF